MLFRSMQESNSVDTVKNGEKAAVVLDNTPFYAESGGQIGDVGVIENSNMRAVVRDTCKIDGVNVHIVKIEKGELKKTRPFCLA